ncbi:MAG TPA: FKBP-type peptidyl-prolyl cis-trans isomerase [Baekduia sp.]|uniref:FKBP-type peptidyl-prolyl cis-trans isomerase n=1 Tax=Baekduia sp. TaxID=2600305 RepID=UPI002D7A1FB0|nr:FKBP-type peptidyl-prolyl cis-trans isomerase [Baekduia sp.]HET6509668.1 FKBP-type peptidyl-prolyl cis-trans isomerase [Baekduia sp.]
MTRIRNIALSLSVLALAGGAVAGCGGSDNSDGFRKDGSKIDGDPATTLPAELASTKSSIKTRQPGEPLPAQTSVTGVSTDLGKKPDVPKATGAAPKELQGSDVVVGTGAEAKDGDKVTVQYVGTLFSNGKEFDTSWKKGRTPFEFTIGQGQVIQGWDQGVPGMKVGGRRVLVIPSDLAYGSAGSPPTIPADAPLIFVVDLKKVSKGS